MMCRCHNYGSVEANIITPKVLCMALLKVYKLAAGVGDIDLRDRCHGVNTVALEGRDEGSDSEPHWPPESSES